LSTVSRRRTASLQKTLTTFFRDENTLSSRTNASFPNRKHSCETGDFPLCCYKIFLPMPFPWSSSFNVIRPRLTAVDLHEAMSTKYLAGMATLGFAFRLMLDPALVRNDPNARLRPRRRARGPTKLPRPKARPADGRASHAICTQIYILILLTLKSENIFQEKPNHATICEIDRRSPRGSRAPAHNHDDNVHGAREPGERGERAGPETSGSIVVSRNAAHWPRTRNRRQDGMRNFPPRKALKSRKMAKESRFSGDPGR